MASEMKVKHILEDLSLVRLRELCRGRDFSTGGSKGELQERLCRSYRGDVAPLLESLSRTEVIAALEPIFFEVGDRTGTFTYLAQAKREHLQEIARLVYGDNWNPQTTDDSCSPEGCPVRLQWSEPEPVGDGRERLFSTQHAGVGFAKLSTEELRHELIGARRLSVASAYYDPAFFRDLLSVSQEGLESLRGVRIVVNGLGGVRLNRQIEELSLLQRDLAKDFEDVEIRLVFAKAIFHPKLYLIRKLRFRIALIGSANATTAAMSDNEEILLRLTDDTASLDAYFEHIWLHEAKPLDARPGLVTTLINFFRTGRIYFKTSTTFQMTVNPFSELLRLLPGAEQRKLTNVRLRYSEPRAGVGPFDLQEALGLTTGDDGSLERQEDEKHSASIKPFSVETCLGYWVPQAETSGLDAALALAGAGKKERFRRIAAKFDAANDAAICNAYDAYIEDARSLFSELPSVPRIVEELGSRNPFRSHERFKARLSALRGNLKYTDYIQRLCQPFFPSVVPEIWGDPVAYEEFRTSFFQYLSYISGLPTWSRVPGRILKVAGCGHDVQGEEIESKLVMYLRKPGWHDQKDWE